MIELTYTTAVEILDGLVEEFGSDYVYTKSEFGKCDYVRDGEPSCIVGHVLVKVGVPIERLRQADTACFGGGIGAGKLLIELEDEGTLKYDSYARVLLRQAQDAQDDSIEWGEAVKYGKRCAQI